MKKFKVGEWVEVVPQKDNNWSYWNHKHDLLKGKPAEICRVEKSKDKKHIFYYLRDLDGHASWFLDRHMILIQKQDRRFIENMRDSCKQLQQHERLCKRLRDEMLHDIFIEKRDDEELFEEIWDDDDVDLTDDLEEDWENVVTKPVVPLPGKGKRKTKFRKNSKKMAKKQKKKMLSAGKQDDDSVDTSNMDPVDWMTDDELQEYLDDVYGIDWL